MKQRVPQVLEMMGQLVATPSVSSVSPQFDQGNRAVIEHLASWLEELGFATEVQALDTHPDKANLIATLGTGPGGLVLAGHTDTVPYDEAHWGCDPFRLTERDGRLYGLGTSDMKGFFALAIEAASAFQQQDLQEPLILLATADEESGMEGAEALVRLGRPRGRHAVVGEPTGLKPVRLHKGIMMETIRLRGRAGHSSDPSLGRSALEGMHRVIGELLRWRDAMQRRYHSAMFKVPGPTLNLGRIHGGDNPNRICAECELHIDLRPLPGMDLGELRAQLHDCVARALGNDDLSFEIEPLMRGVPSMETAADAAIVQAAEKLTGCPSEAVAFGTEGPFLQRLGMETLILGPGDIDQAHQPDEYLAMSRLDPTVTLLRELITSFCVRRG